MSLWNPLSFVMLASSGRREARQRARRWAKAFAADPQLAADLVQLGGLLDGELRQPVLDATGQPTGIYEIVPPDPTALAMRSGRRELAQMLLALGTIEPSTFSDMMEKNHDHS